jgi:hypothetical protein
MVAIVKKTLTFEEFLNWDDGSDRSFELVRGVAVPLSEPTAKHEDVVEELCRVLADHCRALNLPYIPRTTSCGTWGCAVYRIAQTANRHDQSTD